MVLDVAILILIQLGEGFIDLLDISLPQIEILEGVSVVQEGGV